MTGVAPRTKLTYEDYLLFPEDGRRHELMDGEHYMTPSPNTNHQRIALLLATQLQLHVTEHRLGEVFASPYDVLLSDNDVVEPDLLFVSSARASIIGEDHLRGAPSAGSTRPNRRDSLRCHPEKQMRPSNASCTRILASRNIGSSIPTWKPSRSIG